MRNSKICYIDNIAGKMYTIGGFVKTRSGRMAQDESTGNRRPALPSMRSAMASRRCTRGSAKGFRETREAARAGRPIWQVC